MVVGVRIVVPSGVGCGRFWFRKGMKEPGVRVH